jgi:aryl-alcohol dehydrogenase-like predicted oxidoreductase
LAHPAVATIVAGASSPEQVRSNARAVRSQHLTQEEVILIKELSKAGKYKEHR